MIERRTLLGTVSLIPLVALRVERPRDRRAVEALRYVPPSPEFLKVLAWAQASEHVYATSTRTSLDCGAWWRRNFIEARPSEPLRTFLGPVDEAMVTVVSDAIYESVTFGVGAYRRTAPC